MTMIKKLDPVRTLRTFALALVAAAAFALAVPEARAQFLTDDAARSRANQNAADIADIKKALGRLNQNIEGVSATAGQISPDDFAKLVADNQETRRQLGALRAQIQQLEETNRALQGGIDESKHEAASAQSAASASAETARQLLDEIRAQSATPAVDAAQLSAVQSSVAAALAAADARVAELDAALAAALFEIGELRQFVQVPDERELYESASAAFQRRDYETALAEFRRVLKLHPGGRFSDGARYWESAALFFLNRHDEAAAAAAALAAERPESDKRPDALLILARAQKALGDAESARVTLEGVIESDPTSLAADKARQLLAGE